MVKGIFPGKEAIVIITVYFMHKYGQILLGLRLGLQSLFKAAFAFVYGKDVQRLHPKEYRKSNNVGCSGVVHGFFAVSSN